MCGSATFAMVVSSTSMNAAMATSGAIIHGLTGRGSDAASALSELETAELTVPLPLVQRTCRLTNKADSEVNL